MNQIIVNNPSIDQIRSMIEEAGNTIGSVHFTKREDGSLRKMCYRLHVQKPSVAKAPKGTATKVDMTNVNTTYRQVCTVCGRTKGTAPSDCELGPYKNVAFVAATAKTLTPATPAKSKKAIDEENNQMTVLDANKTVRDSSGKVIGRGQWRTISLENVVRVACKGKEYLIHK